MTRPVRSIRLEKRSSNSLDTLSGSSGEIFFDSDNNCLRVYTANQGARILLADRAWVLENTFDADYNSLTNKPFIPSIAGLASETFVNTAINDAVGNIDLTGLATEQYVDDALQDVDVDLAGYATETYVNNAVSLGSPNAELNDITDVDLVSSTPQTGDVLVYDGTTWGPGLAFSGGVSQFDDLTNKPTTIAGYGITDAFDGAYSSLTGAPTSITAFNISDGSNGQVLTTNGNGVFTFTTVTSGGGGLTAVQDDLLPRLGGTLDAGGNNIDMGTYTITDAKVGNWDTAFSWGDHSTAGYLAGFTESDPVFSASDAAAITSAQISNWDIAHGWGDHSTAGYLSAVGGSVDLGTGNLTANDVTATNDVIVTGDVSAASFSNSGVGAPVITSASTITLEAPDGFLISDGTNIMGTISLDIVNNGSDGAYLDLQVPYGNTFFEGLKIAGGANTLELDVSSNSGAGGIGGAIKFDDELTIDTDGIIFSAPVAVATSSAAFSSNAITFDVSNSSYLRATNAPTADWTVNFTNAFQFNTGNKVHTYYVEIPSNSFRPSSPNVDGVSATILWENGVGTGANAQINLYEFKIISHGGSPYCAAKLTTYSN